MNELRPSLLVSLHDVSPLTLDAIRLAWSLLKEWGISARHITLLVIPNHEGRAPLPSDPATVTFLRQAVDAGATLVQHGYTHRIPRPLRDPRQWFWGYGFARGQGEFYALSAQEARVHLDAGRELLARAGLASASDSFVAPAWLMSKGAAAVIRTEGFRFVETLGGLEADGRSFPLRVLGWGSLSGIEAAATSWWTERAARRDAADARLAIHPTDLRSPRVARSLPRVWASLRESHELMSYGAFLAAKLSTTFQPSRGHSRFERAPPQGTSGRW